MFKVNNKDTRTTPLSPCSGVPIVNFEREIAGWEFPLHFPSTGFHRDLLNIEQD